MPNWKEEFTVGEVAGVIALMTRNSKLRGFKHDYNTIMDRFLALNANTRIELLKDVRVILQSQDTK